MIRVVTSAEAAALDRAAIDSGTPSRALMQRAGAAAAAEIALRFGDRLRNGVLVFAGPGNNGGDAWVVAGALAASGARVRVCEPVPAATDDAKAERESALPRVELVPMQSEQLAAGDAYRGEGIVVDGLLGTGSNGAPRGIIGAAVIGLRTMRERGAALVALDVPSGLDSTTGEVNGAARASVTLTFASIKRGHLLARQVCGRIVVLDIGITTASHDGPALVDRRYVAEHVPEFTVDAHKGTRKKLAIIGGGAGMGGAALLAATAAWRSGVGMVKVIAAADTLASVREAEPQTLTAPLPQSDADVARDITGWADAVVIGPGLGVGGNVRAIVDRVLGGFAGPAVIDADALSAFGSDINAMAGMLAGRPAILTPHFAEFGRLTGTSVDEAERRRFDVPLPLAKHTRAVVLLKGQPTILAAPNGERLVTASGTPLLAAAGSGDVLAGMAGTLLAQVGDPLVAAACAAWVHGRAAWLVQRGKKSLRGFSLADVLAQLNNAWTAETSPSRSPVLLELPDIMPQA